MGAMLQKFDKKDVELPGTESSYEAV